MIKTLARIQEMWIREAFYKLASLVLVIIMQMVWYLDLAQAYLIKFDDVGIFSHEFGPRVPSGKGLLEFRHDAGSDPDGTNFILIPPSGFPPDRSGTNLRDQRSPIEIMDGNPGVARVITDLSVAHGPVTHQPGGQQLGPLPGDLSQSFTATGFWRIVPEAGDIGLKQVALLGSIQANVQLDPPSVGGSAKASVSGEIKIEPFTKETGKITFSSEEKSSGGTFGITLQATPGVGLTISPAPPQSSTNIITYSDIVRDILVNKDYKFSFSGTLSASLSGTGLSGTAFSLVNLLKDEFKLIPTPCIVPGPAPSPRALQQEAGCIDFGDAPDSYKTLLESDGPRYREGGLQRLGALWDDELNGQPTPRADGDDRSILSGCVVCGNGNGEDDEDGVFFGDRFVDVTFTVTRDGLNNYLLRAWWDVNRNGCFDHLTADMCNTTSELFIDDLLTLSPGVYTRHYDLPFDPTDFYSRFRLTWDPADGDVWPYREYVSRADGSSHGEVEDYPPVPEPSTWFLLATGCLGLLGYGWRRRSCAV